uniref:Uncharacterized protein n=1 Tax=Ditylenchus dipsaci TaxID=166011 RepID=A0A915E782_9BILA
MASSIPPRLRRNRMIANLEYLLNDKLEQYCFITPKFIMKEYDDVADSFTLQEELDFFDTTIFELLEKNFPNTYFLHKDGEEPGFLRKSLINQPLQLVKTSDLECIEPANKQMAIEYEEVSDAEPKQQITPASTISKFLDEEDEPSNQKDASVSDADSAYSTPESDQQAWSVVNTKIVEKADLAESTPSETASSQTSKRTCVTESLEERKTTSPAFVFQRREQRQSLPPDFAYRSSFSPQHFHHLSQTNFSPNFLGMQHPLVLRHQFCSPNQFYRPAYGQPPPMYSQGILPAEYESAGSLAPESQINDPLELDGLQKERSVCPPPGFAQRVSWPLYSRKTKVKSPDITRQEISLEWSKNANNVPDNAPKSETTLDTASESNVEKRVNNSAKSPLYLELLVGVPPPGYGQAQNKALYSSMARKPKDGADVELAELLHKVSNAKEEVKRTVRNASESLSEVDPVDKPRSQPLSSSDTPSRSSLDSEIATSKQSSTGQLSQDLAVENSKNKQKECDEGYFCESDFECDPEPAAPVLYRSVHSSPNSNVPEIKVVCKPICYSLRGDLIQNYEAASEYRRKLVRNCLLESVETNVQDWAYTFPNISTVIRILMKLRDQYPNGCTPLQVSLFEKCVRKQFQGMKLSDMLPPFAMLLEEGLLLVSNGAIKVAPEIGYPNFICLRKNFVSNLYRLLLLKNGFAKVDDLIPFLKQLAPKNFLIKKENILNICNRLPLVFLLEAYKGLDGYRYEHAVVRLNPDIPDWRIILDSEANEFDCQVCDCSGCRLIS